MAAGFVESIPYYEEVQLAEMPVTAFELNPAYVAGAERGAIAVRPSSAARPTDPSLARMLLAEKLADHFLDRQFLHVDVADVAGLQQLAAGFRHLGARHF